MGLLSLRVVGPSWQGLMSAADVFVPTKVGYPRARNQRNVGFVMATPGELQTRLNTAVKPVRISTDMHHTTRASTESPRIPHRRRPPVFVAVSATCKLGPQRAAEPRQAKDEEEDCHPCV